MAVCGPRVATTPVNLGMAQEPTGNLKPKPNSSPIPKSNRNSFVVEVVTDTGGTPKTLTLTLTNPNPNPSTSRKFFCEIANNGVALVTLTLTLTLTLKPTGKLL